MRARRALLLFKDGWEPEGCCPGGGGGGGGTHVYWWYGDVPLWWPPFSDPDVRSLDPHAYQNSRVVVRDCSPRSPGRVLSPPACGGRPGVKGAPETTNSTRWSPLQRLTFSRSRQLQRPSFSCSSRSLAPYFSLRCGTYLPKCKSSAPPPPPPPLGVLSPLTLYSDLVPFWFSTEHLWILIAPFWSQLTV